MENVINTPKKGEQVTIANALTFIKRAQKESDLRSALNRAPSAVEFSLILMNERLKFSSHEFEEAFSMKLVNCQEPEEAEDLRAFKTWWDLLHMSHTRADKDTA